MSKKKYTLTISILASNRKDTLPKTLESIKPILDNVSSELIITDTGCDEELLSVIRQYTDKVVKFQWCQDFAKARNVGLKLAQGDWFMFIDDDEWFENVDEIVSFFNSDEKNQYNFGRYIVRNYKNMEGTAWSDSVAGRMFRIMEGTIFVDAIHEWAKNVAGPIKSFKSFAHHYGYVYKTEEDRQAHIKRNLELLHKQVENNKTEARHYVHTAQEYCILKDYDSVIKMCEDGISNANLKDKANKKDVSSLCAMKIWALVNQSKNKEAYNEGIAYLKSDVCGTLGKYAISEFVAVASHMDGAYGQAIEYAEKYFEYRDYFIANPEEKFQQSASLIADADSPESVQRVATIGFVASSYNGNIAGMKNYMRHLDFDTSFAIPDIDTCAGNIVRMMSETITLAAWSQMLNEILKHDGFARTILREVFILKESDVDGYHKIADIMTMTDSERGHVWYLRIISAKEDIYDDRLTYLYRKLMDSDVNLLTFDNELWDIAVAKRIDINKMITVIPMDKWMVMVDRWIADVKIKELIEKRQYLDALIKGDTPHMRYMDVAMSEALLIRVKLEGITPERLGGELANYAGTVLDFYKEIYVEDIIHEHPSVLPARCQAAVLVNRMCSGEISGSDIRNVKEQIVSLMPKLTNVMDKYEELV